MRIVSKIKRAVRGEVTPSTVFAEAVHRAYTSLRRRTDRLTGEPWTPAQPPRLNAQFARMHPQELLDHFRNRAQPSFLHGFSQHGSLTANLQQKLFPEQTIKLVNDAQRIVNHHSWGLLGLGEKSFGDPVDWHRDPVNDISWPLEHHADINLTRNDGSDVRMLWELNRLPHFITLGRAFAVTQDDRFSAELFKQLATWRSQNPFGRGVNWNCAMEVALRSLSLLASFELIRKSQELNADRLSELLADLDQHGTFIRRNLEFSYVITSNHYLSDIVGLLWLGVMLPELERAAGWRRFALREMLSEMDKQVLNDGGDFEASTAYHRFVTESFLLSFILCRANGIEIAETYWRKLHSMLAYMRSYMKPEATAPLIGDSDSGQVLSVRGRSGNDHAHLLAIGAAVFEEASFKLPNAEVPEELLWILGEQGLKVYEKLSTELQPTSQAFPDTGTYVMRQSDLYLLVNTSGAGLRGRGSHGHNDALSVEVSACGTSFLVDPGTYFYKPNLHERHLFRSTAYHSTVEVDGLEQNTTNESTPFVIGDEARGQVLSWETHSDHDLIIAKHRGYERFANGVTHQRAVEFKKKDRFWIIEDSFAGRGQHVFRFRFHFAPGLDIRVISDGRVEALEPDSNAKLVLLTYSTETPVLEQVYSSRDYGEKRPSISVCWSVAATPPVRRWWVLVPLCHGEDRDQQIEAILKTKPVLNSPGAENE